ncbi:MAG TPA: glycosyltransferase, partial [Terriglobales bacterium]|nr:glycosyltransferase [Terriglobales bacterium]
VQEAWLHAQESESPITFDPDSMNPHYGYMDEQNRPHEVWYLDAVTAINQMRAARALGINTFALWRLGAEDGSLWQVWDLPRASDAAEKLRSVPPGQDVDREGRGDVLRIEQAPSWGWRNLTLDPAAKDPAAALVTDEDFSTLPLPYQVGEYGWSKNKVAITFDDGPDPNWTPRILDVLKEKDAKATFFLIGDQAEKFPGLLDRIYREGHEIGNHTWSHPDVSNERDFVMRLEINSTERLFEARLGVKTTFFRPPYSIDEEPDTAAQVEPLVLVQAMGYTTIGSKIDPNDWRPNPRRTPEQIVQDVVSQATEPRPQCNQPPCGNIILLHDGGGDRSATVEALPLIIDALRARGFEIVQVSDLLGKKYAEVMTPISANERWSAIFNRITFQGYTWIYQGVVIVFFLGNILMSLRLLFIGGLAIYDRLRSPREPPLPDDQLPSVAVLVPAFNEERVIVNTVNAALASEYPPEKLKIIVIDDGSADATVEITERIFAGPIRSGRLVVLSKPNAGKAEALNYGLTRVQEEIFVGIDADTAIAPTAIARLVTHFHDPRVGAVAGNAKVGNRVNLWTRWQALEYITSQNFERRALDALGAVTVVPGALGAWRTQAVRELGGFHVGTVAEDADLTMSLLQHGFRVEYEDRALAFTEAPINANGLMRQRFRWSFGILQAVWKHRSAFRRKGLLGWVALPNIVIFQFLLPVVSPAIDLMFVAGVLSYAIDRHFHPVSANPASLEKLALFFLIFLITDFIASVIAFSLERREPGMKEDPWLLGQIWLQRFSYRQLFSVVMFKTIKRAIDGRPFSWDKLERTAAVPAAQPQTVGS